MNSNYGLTAQEWELIRSVLMSHPSLTGALLFGSRAKGTFHPASDIDLALEGVDDPLQVEAIAEELEALPLPYRFVVKALAGIRHQPLREHIARVGVRIVG